MKTSFEENIFGSLGCQEPRKHNIKKVPINKVRHNIIYWNNKKRRKLPAGREAYASSGLHSNRSAMARATSSTLNLAVSTDPSIDPCIASSREMLGSWLRNHISTWSAIACVRAHTSSSRRLPPAPSATSPFRTGLKPKDARAASSWPRKLQMCCASPAQDV
jgi:hypothetical protein